MKRHVERIQATCRTYAQVPANALQAIAMAMPQAAGVEPAPALVSAADRASLVHIWDEKWGNSPRAVESSSPLIKR